MSIIHSTHHSDKTKPVEIVYDEERIKILIDETRKEIMKIMADQDQDLSVTEIAELLNTNPQRIYHHVDKLVEFKFLKKTREERKKRSITTYYARTADAFIVSYSTDRGHIHDQALIDHFVITFRNILSLDLSIEEEIEFGNNIKQLAQISEQIYSKFSIENQSEIQRHSIENLYFLLEYMLFFENPKARKLMQNIQKLLHPEIGRN